MDEFYEWQVVWFPPDRDQRASSPTRDEAAARKSLAKAQENGWCPILQRRLVGGWEHVENPTFDHKPTDSEDQR